MSDQWMPRKEWDALVGGENCPLCQVTKAQGVDNAWSYYVADLSFSRLFLSLCRMGEAKRNPSAPPGKSPFNGWENWRPDPSWKVPILSERWDML